MEACNCDRPRAIRARGVKAVVRDRRIQSMVAYRHGGQEQQKTRYMEPEQYREIVYCTKCGLILKREKQ